jgi:hypothetical protein
VGPYGKPDAAGKSRRTSVYFQEIPNTPRENREAERTLEEYIKASRPAERADAALVIRGLRRKTCEPIAAEAGVHCEPTQFLGGAGKWDDEAVMAELRRRIYEELADDRAVIVIAATTSPKSGDDSCGVARKWCGRLGKRDNCKPGVFLAYAAPGGCTGPRTGPATRSAVSGATCPKGPASRRSGGSPRTCRGAAARACPTGGWSATTVSAARLTPGLGFARRRGGTCRMSPVTRWSATWSAGGRLGARAGWPSDRCRTAGSTPGRRRDRRPAGPG